MATASQSSITLTLSREEAITLSYLCNQIGGCPIKSARKHTDSIGDALQDAGVFAPRSYKTALHEGYINFLQGSLQTIKELP